MEPNLVGTQMDEHLMNIQRDTKAALDRFERSGLRIDKKFLKYFMRLSLDRLTQTCERYGAEAKYTMACTTTTVLTPNLGSDNTITSSVLCSNIPIPPVAMENFAMPSVISSNIAIPQMLYSNTMFPSVAVAGGNMPSVAGDVNMPIPFVRTDNMMVSPVEMPKIENSAANNNNTAKRKLEDATNANRAPLKKQKPTEATINDEINKSSRWVQPVPPNEERPILLNKEVTLYKKPAERQAPKIPTTPTLKVKTPNQLNSTRVEKAAGGQVKKPNSILREAVAPNDPTLIRMLIEQKKLSKSVFVSGIWRELNITDKYGIFMDLCKLMGVTISRGSIQRVDQQLRGLAVELYRHDVKNMIMQQTHDNFVWSNQLVKLGEIKKPWKIRIRQNMTNFYTQLWLAAQSFFDQHRLYSFNLSENGLVVKRTSTCTERVVLSEQQLLQYINES